MSERSRVFARMEGASREDANFLLGYLASKYPAKADEAMDALESYRARKGDE